MAASSKPSPRGIVDSLMEEEGEKKKNCYGRNGGVARQDVVFHVYKCPKGNLCVETGKDFFQKGKGFSNPYRHLKACLAGGDEQHLISMDTTVVARKQAWVPNNFYCN